MKDSFADVLKDMRSLVGNAPPDGRITVDTLEHFYQRLDGVAKNTSDALDWYEYMAKQMQRATLQVDSQVMLGLMKELALDGGSRARSANRDADAKLIAAAPGLLAAARAALHYMRLHKYADQAWADDLEAAIAAAVTPND